MLLQLQCSHTHAMKTQKAPDFLDKVLQKKNLKLNTKKIYYDTRPPITTKVVPFILFGSWATPTVSLTHSIQLWSCFCNCHFFGNDHFPCEFSNNKSSFTFFLFIFIFSSLSATFTTNYSNFFLQKVGEIGKNEENP